MAIILAAQVVGYVILGVAVVALAAITWSFVRDVRNALRTGWVRLGGNTPALRAQAPKFSRQQSPALYWLGVAINAAIAAVCAGCAVYLVVVMARG